MRRDRIVISLASIVLLAAAPLLLAQSKWKKPVKRAEPPKIEHRPEIFFGDAFKEGLSGSRPANLGQPAKAVAGTPAGCSLSSE